MMKRTLGSARVPMALVAAAALLAQAARADISLHDPMGLKDHPVALKARPFELGAVRLLDGPFKQAMERDRDYLLRLDPDRLLHVFRVNANLPSSAKPMGGWEAPRIELRGHFVGHYLSGCALMYASTGDQRLKDRAELMVRELARCQEALGASGYLSAFPESFLDRVETTGKVWAPYYTLHKIHAGLLDVHAFCGNAQALEVAKKFGNWVATRNGDRLSDAQVEKMLDVEHGGINESMANLYAVTGDARYLQAAKRLNHKKVLDPLAAGEDTLNGLHANTQFPKVIGAARLYELTGDPRFRTMAEFFWDRVANHHSYAIGGNSDHEHFGPPDKLAQRISPWTAESCNTYNMLKLTRHLFAWSPSATEADYFERAIYNHILASQDPRTGLMAYHIPMHGAWFMPYNTEDESFWCCTGTGVENHAKYGDSIYWHEPGDAGALIVNLFIPSELSWKQRGVTARLRTRYPEEDAVNIELACAQPTKLAIRLRHPAWTRPGGIAVSVSGEAIAAADSRPGSYVTIDRTWKDGDKITLKLPMDLRLEPMPDDPNRVAICYGPVVLAGMLGSEGIVPPMPYAKSQSEFFKGRAPASPALVAQKRPVSEWVKPVEGKPLTFRTQGVGKPQDVTLVAFYALPPQRYSIYWDLVTPEQWQEQQKVREALAQRERELRERTVDAVDIGDSASERIHKLQGERTQAGAFGGRPWRHASDGGWFSYDLAKPAEGDAKLELLVTYWGSDGAGREFDILINNQKIATQRLARDKPDQFFDVTYPIPAELLKDKPKVWVKFQAHPARTAGGIFDCRIMRAK